MERGHYRGQKIPSPSRKVPGYININRLTGRVCGVSLHHLEQLVLDGASRYQIGKEKRFSKQKICLSGASLEVR